MDYIVFGDDWKSHSSTTQHLINHLSDKDKVIWINSIGMRAPELNLYDVKRLIKKAVDMIKNDKEKESEQTFKPLSIIQPKIIPFHKTAIVKKINRLQIHYLLKSIINKHQLKQPIILTANPVVTDYLPKRYLSRLCYLRLDNYALYGGVDKQLAIDSEKLTLKKARVVFYTAKELDPKRNIGKDVYLPQGVDIENFIVDRQRKYALLCHLFFLILRREWDSDPGPFYQPIVNK